MKHDIGHLGEDLVAHWLQTQSWEILARRWRCRWGEIDLITQLTSPTCAKDITSHLAFVEVKTRSQGNWDADGLLALTPQKQAKLGRTAQLFLAQHPELANLPCRFDVALVCCQRSRSILKAEASPATFSAINSPPSMPSLQLQSSRNQLKGYQFTLQAYLESAFSI